MADRKALNKKLVIAGVWLLFAVAGYIVSKGVVPELLFSGADYKLMEVMKIVADIVYVVCGLVGICKLVKALHKPAK